MPLFLDEKNLNKKAGMDVITKCDFVPLILSALWTRRSPFYQDMEKHIYEESTTNFEKYSLEKYSVSLECWYKMMQLT